MSNVHWNSIIIQCENAQSVKPASELCAKQRVGMIIVPQDCIDNAILGRGILQAKYAILTTIQNKDQKRPGHDKLIGATADIFDAEGYEISPMNTDNPSMLLNDLRQCSSFLRDNLHQQIKIGWNLSDHKLKDQDILILLDMIAKGYRPDYIRFGENQGLISTIAKKACGTKIALPFESDVESDYKTLEASAALKVLKQQTLN